MIIKEVFRKKNWATLLANLKWLAGNNLQKTLFEAKDEAIEDAILQASAEEIPSTLKVLDARKTIAKLRQEPKGFARFGDGEINLIRGISSPFQTYSRELAEELLDVLQSSDPNLYVGINYGYFHRPSFESEVNRMYYVTYGTQFRRFLVEYCSGKADYLDSCCFLPYAMAEKGASRESITGDFDEIKQLFSGKKLIVVAGKGVLDGLEYDIFDEAKTFDFVSAPSRNAYESLSEVESKIISKAEDDCLACITLGIAGTVLAARLAKKGILAWDVGHMPKGYNAFMHGSVIDESFWRPD